MRGNQMGDVSFNPSVINDEPLPQPLPLPDSIAQDDKVIGLQLMSAGWTNEKHITYISSMEASFVDQLYGLRKHVPNSNNSHFGNDEFKVFQDAVCKNLGFEESNARLHDGSQSENTMMRRFRPRNAAVNRRGNVMDASIDDYGSGTDSVQKKVQTRGREAKICVEESLVGKSKEVSDQNFSEEDIEANNQRCKKRRPKSQC